VKLEVGGMVGVRLHDYKYSIQNIMAAMHMNEL